MKASTTICRLVLSFLSQFFQSRRHFSSQAKDRSTTHRFGSATKVCSSLRFTTSTEELHRQRAKGARAVADQINLRCKCAADWQKFVRRTLPATVRQSICHAHVTRRSWQVARRSAQNSREQVILEEIQCRRRSNVQPDAQRAGYGYQQVGSAVPVAD